MKLFKRLTLLFSTVAMLTACASSSNNGDGNLQSLSFRESTITLSVNEIKSIGLITNPAGSSDLSFLNYSKSIIELDMSNLTVKGLKLGEGTIKATCLSNPNLNATLKVRVSSDGQGGGGSNYQGSYYNSIDGSASGTSLLSALQTLNKTKLTYRVGYDQMKSKFVQTDPGTRSGEVTSFYSGKSATYSGNMNREHVWPASKTVLGRGKDPLEDDIHMVRPTLTSENSSRGNSFFAENGAWDPATFNNPSYRGDAARIIFYCVVADSQLSLVDQNSDKDSNHTMGKLSDLLRWNIEYSVANRENVRNDAAQNLQGNRNPFIDHPEYACKIWGSYNSNTRAICGM